jgi:hypothetical protein
MLGFLGNMTSELCCVTMGLLRFLSNATVPVAQQCFCVSLVTQQLKRALLYFPLKEGEQQIFIVLRNPLPHKV